MKGGAGLVGPERFVRSAIFLDELVVEDCVEIRQLIDSIIFFFTEAPYISGLCRSHPSQTG